MDISGFTNKFNEMLQADNSRLEELYQQAYQYSYAQGHKSVVSCVQVYLERFKVTNGLASVLKVERCNVLSELCRSQSKESKMQMAYCEGRLAGLKEILNLLGETNG